MKRLLLLLPLVCLLGGPARGHASAPVGYEGTCTFTLFNDLAISFPTTQPTYRGALSAVEVNVSGSGNCAGDPVTSIVTMSFDNTILMSCDGGQGTLWGGISIGGGPSTDSAASISVGSPGTVHLAIKASDLSLVAVGDFGWDGVGALVGCAGTGASSSGLIGTLEYSGS
ncbi:MAG: hypothetical protein ACYDAY_07675 [Candidatus Dormibacteria bacterium]